ncbi:hypothetical protein [Haloparvum sedimenti]|uniref:hypothetical protein n=1 Tax=Haloparvum sedimenti TaxID=1678448 RepID=UPI00071E9887|nr:hypothetical protein [Haloparvum sedimenti]
MTEAADGERSRSWRERVELERRLVHAAGVGFVVPYLIGWLSWAETRLLLAAGLIVVALLEFLRLAVGLDHAVYRKLTRPYEVDNVAGYALYMLSMAGAGILLPRPVAIPAMLMLALGDPVSGALGDNAADEPKRPLVWIAMFLTCLALALPFTVAAAGPTAGAAAAALGALGATVADGLPPIIRGYPVDDNLTIPPAAAAGLLLGFTLVG